MMQYPLFAKLLEVSIGGGTDFSAPVRNLTDFEKVSHIERLHI